MAAIVRVKRSRTDNPANTIVVSCKRAKLDQVVDVKVQTDLKGVFKFAATVDRKCDEVTSCVKEAIKKEKLQRELKHHASTAGILQKARGCQKQQIISNRFKVVAEKRAVTLNDLDEENQSVSKDVKDSDGQSDSATTATSDRLFHLFDVAVDATADMTLAPPPATKVKEEVVTCNNVPMIREKVLPSQSSESADCVYDIYYLNQADFDFRALENILAVEATREEYVYDDYRDGDEEVYDDEDNADDENNWRNDYPDEDPQFCENWEKDYEYDELGGADFSYDDWGTSQMLKQKLQLAEDKYSEEEPSSEDEDHAYFTEPMHPTELSTALESYDKYKQLITNQLEGET